MDDTALQPSIAGKPSPLGLYAPSPVYVTGEESLRLTSFGNAAGVTLTFAVRMLGPDGVVRPTIVTHAPNSNRTAARTIVTLSEGWILGLQVVPSAGAPSGGAVWCIVELVRGSGATAIALQALTSDFVSAGSPLMWPSGELMEPLDGEGNLRSIAGTTPGAGVEITETVPAGARWEPIAFRALLTTSAAAANRVPALVFDDGATEYSRAPVGVNEIASLAWVNTWAEGQQRFADLGNNAVMAGYAIRQRLGPGHRIRTNTAALQAGDQWSNVQYLVLEWFDV